mgnify:CR=1 FL=1|tara:strand:+ start:79 stop:549 length:471 start_codon:yes stop_codon:yes gene_type:complete
MRKKTNSGLKIITLNRKASFNYFFEDLIEAGIVLKGSEIKSIRNGKVNISDSYAIEKNGEIVLINSHVASYKEASYSNHKPLDERKLLLNKKEINKLIGRSQREGFTLVPTKMYFKKGKAKIEIAVAKGKKHFDKRQVKKDRDWNRYKARYVRKTS